MDINIVSIEANPTSGTTVYYEMNGDTLPYNLTDDLTTPLAQAIRSKVKSSDKKLKSLEDVAAEKKAAQDDIESKASGARLRNINKALSEFTEYKITELSEIQDAQSFLTIKRAMRFEQAIKTK